MWCPARRSHRGLPYAPPDLRKSATLNPMEEIFTWTPWGLFGATGGALSLLAAITIWRTTPNRLVRNRFTLLFIAEAMMMLTGILGPPQWLLQESHAYSAMLLHFSNDCLLLAVYLPAIAVAVDSPLLRPFRHGWGRGLVVSLGIIFFIAIQVLPAEWVAQSQPGLPGYGSPYSVIFGPLIGLIFVCLVTSYVYGLVATVLVWRASSSEAQRRKNGALSLAFASRDISWGGIYLFATAVVFLGVDQSTPDMLLMGMYGIVFAYFCYIVYICLTAYGIAFLHILDIDLKIKKTLKASTVTAMFVAFFFIVSEISAVLLSDQIGPILALFASGALLFFLAPLQDLAAKLSDKAMPTVQDTPEYQNFRRLQIYGAAVEDALKSGAITGAQRVALDYLLSELQLPVEDAHSVELKLGAT